jgi:hypothetical protein
VRPGSKEKKLRGARFEHLLDYVFWCGVEVSVLTSPILFLLLWAPEPIYASLSASVGLLSCSVLLTLIRGGYLWFDDEGWPRMGDPYSLPFRTAHYGATIASGTYLGVAGAVGVGVPWLAVIAPVAVVWVGLTTLPRTLRTLRRLSQLSWDGVARLGRS